MQDFLIIFIIQLAVAIIIFAIQRYLASKEKWKFLFVDPKAFCIYFTCFLICADILISVCAAIIGTLPFLTLMVYLLITTTVLSILAKYINDKIEDQ